MSAEGERISSPERWVTPVVSSKLVDYESAVLSCCHSIEVVIKSLVPATVIFEVESAPERSTRAQFTVFSPKARDDSLRLAEFFSTITPWMTLGEPQLCRDGTQLSEPCYEFIPTFASAPRPIPIVPLAWARSTFRSNCWSTRLLLCGIGSSDEERTIRASFTLLGRGEDGDLLAALVSADTDGTCELEAVPLRGRAPRLFEFSLSMIGHLLAVPARLPQEFAVDRTLNRTELLSRLRRGPTPHLLITGASGQGKTTLLTHLIGDAVEHGESIAVFDAHDGQLAADALARAEEMALNPLVLDFSDEEMPPRLSLASCPAGLSAQAWAAELTDVIRSLVWGSMPDEYFGPVGVRGLRLAIEAIVRDPDRIVNFTEIPLLFDPRDSSRLRVALLERIGDDALAKAFDVEIKPMIQAQDSGNSVLFFTSKIDPFIGTPMMRSVIGGVNPVPVNEVVAGRSMIVYAPSSTLGDGGSRLVIGFLLHLLWLCARRAKAVVPLHVVCDEWHRYPVPSIPSILAEGRKFGVWLRLANQSLSQVPPSLRSTAMTNVGGFVTFRAGPQDAAILDDVFPTITARQLGTLARHRLAATMDGEDFMAEAPQPLSAGSLAELRKKHRTSFEVTKSINKPAGEDFRWPRITQFSDALAEQFGRLDAS